MATTALLVFLLLYSSFLIPRSTYTFITLNEIDMCWSGFGICPWLKIQKMYSMKSYFLRPWFKTRNYCRFLRLVSTENCQQVKPLISKYMCSILRVSNLWFQLTHLDSVYFGLCQRLLRLLIYLWIKIFTW